MELLRNDYYKSARHARIILSGIQMFKNLDSRYKLAGMTYYLGRENDILFLVFQKHELFNLFHDSSYSICGDSKDWQRGLSIGENRYLF